MHTVELLEQALKVAGQLGYQVRQDFLGGSGGGGCEIKGQKWLFLDLAQDPSDHLEQVLEALRREPDADTIVMPGALKPLVRLRKSA